MGRTFEIRNDDKYTQNANRQELHSFLSSLPYVQMLTRRFGEYEEGEDSLYMSIDLVLYDGEGNTMDLDHPELLSREDENRVNAVELNIPIGSLYGDERDQRYINFALMIAHHLGWHLYDCDLGKYLEPSSS